MLQKVNTSGEPVKIFRSKQNSFTNWLRNLHIMHKRISVVERGKQQNFHFMRNFWANQKTKLDSIRLQPAKFEITNRTDDFFFQLSFGQLNSFKSLRIAKPDSPKWAADENISNRSSCSIRFESKINRCHSSPFKVAAPQKNAADSLAYQDVTWTRSLRLEDEEQDNANLANF